MLGLCVLLALQPPVAAAAETSSIEELVVSGEQPGPGLWDVRHGAHHLYILATISPLPSKMRWKAGEVEALVARSQYVLGPIQVKAGIGFFQGIRLLPSVLKARDLPKGESLANVLPPAVYARWQVQKSHYLGKGGRIEHWRPMFAAGELYEEALKASQLDRRNEVWPIVEKAARKARVPVRTPEVQLSIADPKGVIRDFAQTPLDADIDCFESLLVRVERELPLMRQRANAWSRGDVATLRRLPLEDAESRCLNAVTSTPAVAREYEAAILHVREDWVLAAEGALLRNASSVAVVPMREVFAPDGLLAQLRARGYAVTEP
ncbi:MAG: hypothetical protein RLZZ393_1935 [Pseudomonadota bacterium]|jgi:hypothetical protein